MAKPQDLKLDIDEVPTSVVVNSSRLLLAVTAEQENESVRLAILKDVAELRQWSIVQGYCVNYEELTDRTNGLLEEDLLNCFIRGLKGEIQAGRCSTFSSFHHGQAMGLAKLQEMTIEFARRSKNSGVPWTEQEHRMILVGLQKLGKDTYGQASLNQTNKLSLESQSIESGDTPMESHYFFGVNPPQVEAQTTNSLPAPPAWDEECESMHSTNFNDGEQVPQKPDSLQCCYPVVIPSYIPQFLPFSVPCSPGNVANPLKRRHMRCLSQQQYI
ncbi:hypothetical protein Vadar_027525 [Vaccinium darrowii]|uniref:Uncharacterized protein n=1 Tax=Vaccinium darrowii TaxID=229202 RepID=A0ACB7YHK7_9ERIC|nr:hypothetical protein Vadar_027525 [Vaccinium darrowii]